MEQQQQSQVLSEEEMTSAIMMPSAIYEEEEDANNISKDDSEEFAVGETAFFRSTTTASDDDDPNSSKKLSPVTSPTPFGTPRIWSAHSLYGEALLHSTRPSSTGKSTCSIMDEEDKNLGPQQPFIVEEEEEHQHQHALEYEDLLVSPSSPVSDTPTTPPSVARKPSLSPPPLTMSEIREDEPVTATLTVNHLQHQHHPVHTTAAAASTAQETMSFNSRTPLRPPRVPGNQARLPTGSSVNNNNNNNTNSAHKRHHRRNGSDSSFMSALTDVSFGSVQTAPPPPRSLPLPLLSSSSSWTRYTNGVTGNQLPVLDNNVSGMNISVPARLQQPVLGDDNGATGATLLPSASHESVVPSEKGTPLHRHSTPPRHRPPKDSKGAPATTAANGISNHTGNPASRPRASLVRQQQQLPKPSRAMASSQAMARQQQQKQQQQRGVSNFASSGTSNAAAFLPIQQVARSFSSDATESRSSPVAPKPRSYSSDVIMPDPEPTERHAQAETQSLPGIRLTSPTPWKLSHESASTTLAGHTMDDPSTGIVHLRDWLARTFSRSRLSLSSCSSTDRFGAALLAMDARLSASNATEDNPPLRKIASSTSTVTDVSRLSANTSGITTENRTLKARVQLRKDQWLVLEQWEVAGIGIALAILPCYGLFCSSAGNKMGSFVSACLQFPLFWVSRFLATKLFHTSDFSPRSWHSRLSGESCLFLLLSRGWPSVLLLWAILDSALSSFMVTASFSRSTMHLFPNLAAYVVVVAVVETLRRFFCGKVLHTILYRRLGNKVQLSLQRIAAVRCIARYARIPVRDFLAVVQEEDPGSVPGALLADLDELAAFQKSYSAFRSNYALSLEFGPIETKKERLLSATALYDAMSVQGRLRLSTLYEAASGNDAVTSLIPELFSSSRSEVVSQADFIAGVEKLYASVVSVANAIDTEMSLLRVVDFASVFIVHIFLITLAVDSMFYLAMATIALAVAFILSSSFEGVVFALFARPFDAGDVIFLNRFDDSQVLEEEQGWKVRTFGFWNTVVQGVESRSTLTVLSNAGLSRSRITTLDGCLPAKVALRLQIPVDIPQQKLKAFRKAVEHYVKDHGNEWIDFISMDVANVRKDTTEYEIIARHRHSAGNFHLIRESRANLLNFCYQAQAHLGVYVGSNGCPPPPSEPKNVMGGYNDDLSEDSITETDNELYFLTTST